MMTEVVNQTLAITASGMVTGVGLDAPSSCAAIRAAIDNFQDTHFMDEGGEWMLGCEVPLEQPWRGVVKLAKMLAMALLECAEQGAINLVDTSIVLCPSETERSGRFAHLSSKIFEQTQKELDITFSRPFYIVEHGRVGALVGMLRARGLIYDENQSKVIVAGVDTLLVAASIKAYEQKDRILTSKNSNGFIPGEAAAAILVEAPKAEQQPQLLCEGIGFGVEKATIDSDIPLRAEGLSEAIANAFEEANTSMNEMDFRIVDVAGEQYWFKETALVVGRFLRVHKEGFPLWHITDCIGEVGAAIGIASIAYVKLAYEKAFDEGKNMLQHLSNSDGKRGAAVFTHKVVVNG